MPRPRLTYANVTSSIALFLALGGTSYAVATLPRNSVGDRQLRAGAVTTAKLADRAVTAEKLAGGAAAAGPRGPRGAEGPAGATGPSDAWSAGSNQVDLTAANVPVVAARIERVPAGSYVLSATAVFVSNAATRYEGRCAIKANGTVLATSVGLFGSDPDTVYAGPVTPLATTTLADAAVLTLECTTNSPPPTNHPVIQGGRLIATKVGALHE